MTLLGIFGNFGTSPDIHLMAIPACDEFTRLFHTILVLQATKAMVTCTVKYSCSSSTESTTRNIVTMKVATTTIVT